MLIATTPFWSALIERLLPNGERFSKRSLAGLALGFSGIVVLVWPEMTNGGAGGRQFVIGVIAIQLACVGWVIGTSYAKRHELGDNPFRSTALQMVFSGIMLLTAATAHGDWAQLSFTPRTIAAMLYLSIAGSLIAYSAYIYAIQHLPLQLVSLYAYINPMIAVALGTLLLNEPLSARILVAAVAGACGDVDCSALNVGEAKLRARQLDSADCVVESRSATSVAVSAAMRTQLRPSSFARYNA